VSFSFAVKEENALFFTPFPLTAYTDDIETTPIPHAQEQAPKHLRIGISRMSQHLKRWVSISKILVKAFKKKPV
jgi:hypothetical protein